jgi:molybdopterin molybdotransferase
VIGFDEALALLTSSVRCVLGTEQVPLAQAHGRVLAEPIHAAISSPRCAVSAMDGYALRNADALRGASYRIVGESFAGGELPPAVRIGECARIFTGAAMPEGTDRVVMQENCIAGGDVMKITGPFGPGWHVRDAASDFAEGDLLLQPGTLLTPRAIVTLAGADQPAALVYKKPRVAIIATGDELVPPGAARATPRSIPESVSCGVAAMAEQYGATIEARLWGNDDLLSLQRLAGRALAIANVVIVTGGASVGERDHANAMFAEQELELLFSKVAIKPGKPVWIGRSQGRWVVGLPGNPVSAMVTARLFLVPMLALLEGRRAGDVLSWLSLPLAGPMPEPGNRTTFVRASMAEYGLVPLDQQDSAAQAALAAADWLVRSDPGDAHLPASGTVRALRF